jgi:predicted enzyme involved in methoxymalonyl-ACP biosynthesis
MSCRVIGRRIETAFLGALISDLAGRGVERIQGIYLPTPKNGMVRDVYAAHGFLPIEGSGEGQHFEWRKGESEIPHSPFVTVQWRTA